MFIVRSWSNLNLNQKHPGCKKKERPRTKKGLDKKEVISKWAAKACVVLLLIKIKFLIITSQAAKHNKLIT